MKYLAIPLIWLLLLLVLAAGFVVGLFALLVAPSYGARIFRTQNRAAAAVLGFSGEHAVSHECGKSRCLFCRAVCRVLSVILEPDHCAKEAQR